MTPVNQDRNRRHRLGRGVVGWLVIAFFHGRDAESPNDPKLSDRGVRRGTCTVGGKAAAEAGAVTHGAVRCSAWLGVAVIREEVVRMLEQSGDTRTEQTGRG